MGRTQNEGFILNMIMTLEYLKAMEFSDREAANVNEAIGILETLRGQENENVL
jgi:hypothetical protein